MQLRILKLYAPKRRFWNGENIRSRHFVSNFHTPSYPIWAKSDEKYLQNVLAEYFSTFQNLRLRAIKFGFIFCSSLFGMPFRKWRVVFKTHMTCESNLQQADLDAHTHIYDSQATILEE